MSDTKHCPEHKEDHPADIWARQNCGVLSISNGRINVDRDELAALVLERDQARDDFYSAIQLIQRIREAAGDPMGKLMQDELVEHIQNLHNKYDEQTAEKETNE